MGPKFKYHERVKAVQKRDCKNAYPLYADAIHAGFESPAADYEEEKIYLNAYVSKLRKKMQQALRAMDQLNRSYGRDTIRYATMGYEKKWAMRQDFLSRRYTTRIEDVIVVNAK